MIARLVVAALLALSCPLVRAGDNIVPCNDKTEPVIYIDTAAEGTLRCASLRLLTVGLITGMFGCSGIGAGAVTMFFFDHSAAPGVTYLLWFTQLDWEGCTGCEIEIQSGREYDWCVFTCLPLPA